jgi:glycosyltransferase involved in cell wall biosynthesis
MIVKNESQVILRCLESARSLVDYVLIEDTGSADGTQRIIRDYLDRNRLLGEVFDAPWQDFAHNRSLALARLREKEDVDYALVMDADDVLVLEEGFDPACFKESLTADLYNVVIKRPTLTFYRELIASNRKEFNYRGVLHECLVGPPGFSADTAKGFYVSDRQEGARSRDPDKFRKDIQVLEQALYKEKDAWLRARYTFYLAQSYLFSDNKQKALKNYLERAKLGFWDEEIYWSLCHAAGIKHALGHPLDEVLATYARASGVCRRRAEAFHSASRLCRENNRFKEGYKLASRGLAVPQPSLGLFLEPWIYEYGLLDEFAVNAYWIGRYDECLEACERLLEEGKCPGEMRERVERNAAFAREKLAAQAVVVATARIGGARASERDTAVPALDLSRHPVSGRNTRGRRRRKK